MLSTYTREKIENWVSDFVTSDRLREAPSATHEHAAAVLVEFMVAACSTRESSGGVTGRGEAIEPDEVEEADLKHALLNRVARLNVPQTARADLPGLCAVFLSQLEDEGRLGGGRVLGAYIRALRETYDEASSGKRKPITRPGAKIGRNDPCPCGRGRSTRPAAYAGEVVRSDRSASHRRQFSANSPAISSGGRVKSANMSTRARVLNCHAPATASARMAAAPSEARHQPSAVASTTSAVRMFCMKNAAENSGPSSENRLMNAAKARPAAVAMKSLQRRWRRERA
jgi:hypothetical protein